MKIEIILESDRKDLQINLLCPTVNQEVNELYAYHTAYEQNVGGWLNERHQRVHINEILYFESVDGKTFFYTNALTCQTKKKLYELEALYNDAGFIRISKTTILSLSKVSEIIPEMGRRLKLRLINGEYLIVSRQYVPELRKRLSL